MPRPYGLVRDHVRGARREGKRTRETRTDRHWSSSAVRQTQRLIRKGGGRVSATYSQLDPHERSGPGRVSRRHRLSATVRNCTRDEGGPFETGSQVQVSSHRKLLSSRAMVASVAETSGPDPGRQG